MLSSDINKYRKFADVKGKLLSTLYIKPSTYYNIKLVAICEQNQITANIKLGNIDRYGIRYNSKQWIPFHIPLKETEYIPKGHFLSTTYYMHYIGKLTIAFCGNAEEEAAVKKLTDEIAEIAIERYEIDRFLSGLLELRCDPSIVHYCLGDYLYGIWCDILTNKKVVVYPELSAKFQIELENPTTPEGCFVSKNAFIIKELRERVISNLLIK